jgi:para-nitrobenzyl esterase
VLASKGVIVVTINYRLGVMGFLAHPELTAESAHKVSGNYGLLDQIAALRWVHDNISAFGGNAAKVTIFGESAGSLSVSAMVATPLTKGLFARAIGESGAHFGAPGGTMKPVSMAEAETRGTKLAGSMGAKSLAELRAVSAAALIKATSPNPSNYWPIVDGYVFPEDPWDIYAQGKQNHVALLAGWNSAEAKAMAGGMRTREALTAALKKQFPGSEEAALKAYPAGSDAHQTWLSAVALASDNFISYSTWKWIEMQTATGQAPVYRYLFDHVIPTATGDAPADDAGAAHATDIEYVFGTLETKKLAWRDSDRKVSALMVGYWTNFAKTGNPNGTGLAEWPAYNAKSRQVMRLDVSPKAEAETNRARYELQDKRTVELRKQ